jgi:L-rhamnose mutarotase
MKIFKIFLLPFIVVLFFYADGYPKEYSTTGKIREEIVTKRVGSLIKVRPEFEERYIILHKHTFPGVLSQIRKVNIRNYSIFLLDGILFSHFEYVGKDFDADMKSIADETTREWWKLTDPMQEPIPTRKEGEWWAAMEQLMCFDKLVKPSPEARRIGLVADVVKGNEAALFEFFKNYPLELEPDINKANVQNSNFYYKDGKVYFYYEYVGGDIRNDIRALMKNEVFNKSQEDLNKLLVPTGNGPWKVMEEVFHTD